MHFLTLENDSQYIVMIDVTISVWRFPIHTHSRPDEAGFRGVRDAGPDSAAQHAHRHDGKHVSADHFALRKGVEAPGNGSQKHTC